MSGIDWSTITPALLAGALLSIALEWFPGLAGWWETLSPARKTTINALLVALISGGSLYGGCRLWGASCPADTWAAVGSTVVTFLLAAAGNQAVHQMTRREVLRRGDM